MTLLAFSAGSPSEGAALERILSRMSPRAGVDLGAYQRAPLHKRLVERAHKLGLSRLEAYERRLAHDEVEAAEAASSLLNHTTALFREWRTVELLRGWALPDLLLRRQAEGARSIRAWVPGCATGEEAFSLAALLLEARERTGARLSISVLASDVHEPSLAAAAHGLARRPREGEAPSELVDRWVVPCGNDVMICHEARRLVTVCHHDLLDPRAPAPRAAVLASFDVVSCCNVLLHLRPEARAFALGRLRAACEPGALLVLGQAEAPLGAGAASLSPLAPGLPVHSVEA